jgi:pimeloyl-ACP methyl ester carboxylesterase
MKRFILAAAVAASAIAPAAAQADPTPFGNACTLKNTVRFCPATELNQRPTSFDGTPIDADVTLPATGNGPWPTIVMIHGYGGNKTNYESNSNPTTDGLDNNSYAARGYAVVTVSERGFGRSCGHDPATRTAGCDKGYVHLMDTRYEAHDVQYLLGKLVDAGIANPAALGALGASYGGGATVQLAYLKNRVRNTDGTYAVWKSPIGTPLSLKAGFAMVPWSNLASALVPNGRYLDFDSSTTGLSTTPVGVGIGSYISGLYSGGLAAGWYTGAGVDPQADLTTWRNEIFAGEPFSTGALTDLKKISDYHSGYTVGGTPSALLLQNGWTDDLFTPAESLRVYASEKAKGNNNVRLLFDDNGHARSQNPADARANLALMGRQFMDNQLKGIAGGPAAGSATVMGMGCDGKPSGGPWTASSWEKIHPGVVSYTSTKTQTISRTPSLIGGDKKTAAALDPLVGSAQACGKLTDIVEPGVATYTLQSKGITMLGLPTVQATIKTNGKYGVIASRIWDVTAGKRRMIARGVYRLLDNQTGTITFQLHGNAYNFAAGHTIKLELLPQDSPYYQNTKGVFTVKVSKVTLEIPTLEAKNSAKGITSPVISKFKR